jgi:hypothetical protein
MMCKSVGAAGAAASLTLAFALTAPPPAGAQATPVAVSVAADGLSFAPQVAWERATLTVAGPGDWTLEREFARGAGITLTLVDETGQPFPDGAYTYELVLAPVPDPALRQALAAARDADDEAARGRLRAQAPASAPLSGRFTLRGGRIVPPGAREPRLPPAPGAQAPQPEYNIVDSLCVGFDCPGSPSFGDTTILTMENNLRIKFDDTSNLAGFANRDWSLNANDSESGGANRFFVQDCGTSSQGGCTGNAVFSIEGGARANALYVEDGGRVGIGTSTPVHMLHLRYGDSPALRFEQDNSYGWSAYTWDVAGNETNWFVRDITAGSRLPLRIRAGAPTDSLHVYGDGKVGVGTGAPGSSLHVKGSSGATLVQVEETSATTASRNMLRIINNGASTFRFDNTFLGNNWGFGSLGTNNFYISHSTSGTLNLTLSPTGVLTVVDLIETSDRAMKADVGAVDGRALLARLGDLPISTWRFKTGETRHIGPMAQDFRALFGLGPDDTHIRPGDVAGVALAAVQALSEVVAEKDARLLAHQARIDALAEQLARLEARLAAR